MNRLWYIDQTPKDPRKINQIRAQAGILKKAKDQLISAHSPEPLKTISRASLNGKLAIIKSRPGPHPGTLSGGRL